MIKIVKYCCKKCSNELNANYYIKRKPKFQNGLCYNCCKSKIQKRLSFNEIKYSETINIKNK